MVAKRMLQNVLIGRIVTTAEEAVAAAADGANLVLVTVRQPLCQPSKPLPFHPPSHIQEPKLHA